MRTTAHYVLWVGLCAGTAPAQIVHFVNPLPGQPGHYNWHAPLIGGGTYLDITRPSTDQPNAPGGGSIGQGLGGFPGGPVMWLSVVGGGAQFAGIAPDEAYVRALMAGDPIAGLPFIEWAAVDGSPLTPPQAWFPEGERRYIGVLTAAGNHGWIEVERAGLNFYAHAWAYHTVPGAPLAAGQVPAPGGGLLLSLCALSARRRRITPAR